MEQIIQWCNTNAGFVSGLLALFSIMLSVVAICVSIIVAKLPFKKKIAVGFFTNLGLAQHKGLMYYSVEATNIGNRVVKVLFVGYAYKENGSWKKIYNTASSNAQNVMLNVNETVSSIYDINEINNIIKEHKLYAFVVDIEGKIYKRKVVIE